jgi:hypothetical protein
MTSLRTARTNLATFDVASREAKIQSLRVEAKQRLDAAPSGSGDVVTGLPFDLRDPEPPGQDQFGSASVIGLERLGASVLSDFDLSWYSTLPLNVRRSRSPIPFCHQP